MFKWLKQRLETAKRRKKLDAQNYAIKTLPDELTISGGELVQIDMAYAFYMDNNKQAAYESAKVLLDKHNLPEFEVLLLTGYYVEK